MKDLVAKQEVKISRLKAKNTVKDQELEQKRVELEAQKNQLNRPTSWLPLKTLPFIELMLALLIIFDEIKG